jgi:hypothetical protein
MYGEGCESKTCKFMGAGTSETVTNSKEVSIEKQM